MIRPSLPSVLLAGVLIASSVRAADQGVTGKKLLLKNTPKLVLLSKDPGISIVGADPIGGADSSVSFDAGGGPVPGQPDGVAGAQRERRHHLGV